MLLARLVASLLSSLELTLPLKYSSFQSQQSQKQSRQGGLQALLISVASVNVLVLAIPPVVFAFRSTSPPELLGLHFVPFASPICYGLN